MNKNFIRQAKGKYFNGGGVFQAIGFCFLLVIGALSALLPEMMVRLSALVIMLSMLIYSLYGIKVDWLKGDIVKWWLGLVLVVYIFWPTYFMLKIGSLPYIDPRRLVVLCSIIIISCCFVGQRKFRDDLALDNSRLHWLMSYILLGYVFIRLVSCFKSDATISALMVVVWEVINYVLFYFLAVAVFRYIDIGWAFVKQITALVIILSIYVFFEWISGANLIIRIIPISFMGNDNALFFQSVSRIRDGFFRAQGTFEHPIVLAEFAAISMSFALSSILFSKQRAFKLISIIAYISSLSMIYFSGSRSGLISASIVSCLITLLWLFRAKKQISKTALNLKLLTMMSVVIIAFCIAVPTILVISSGSSSDQKTSSQARIEMFNRGIPSIADNPIMGSGVGNALDIAGIVARKGIVTLDSHYLGLAIESGMPALFLLILSLLIPAMFAGYKVVSSPSDNVVFYAGAVGALSIILMVHASLWIMTNLSIGYLISGIVTVSLIRDSERHNSHNRLSGVNDK